MPPRRGIVKSGNAGNSSKPSKAPEPALPTSDQPKPLFPPGSKTPLSLLQERCQKNGWEKPQVDTRRQGDQWAFVITISKRNPKTSEVDRVRLEPHPPYTLPSAIEARHWGATYALYRFCNGLQLHLVLPPGPRDYWALLASEHKSAPEHQRWMYEADPFTARRAVEERQLKAAKKKEAAEDGPSDKSAVPSSREFEHAVEAKMAGSLREMVEDVIKKTWAMYPETQGSSSSVISDEETLILIKQLGHLGFTAALGRKATDYLSRPSSVARSLLESSSPLDACITFLLLNTAEDDLPQRFLPSQNSSNSFVTSTHSGTEDLKLRWLEDRAVKEAGWPAAAVRRCVVDAGVSLQWAPLIFALNRMLVGEDWTRGADMPDSTEDSEEMLVAEDLEGLGAQFVDGTLVLPLNVENLHLHIVLPQDSTNLSARRQPPMYITSTFTAAYIRLHMLAHLLNAISRKEICECGIGFLIEAMGLIQDEWSRIQEDGPPNLADVLLHLLPRNKSEDNSESIPDGSSTGSAHRSSRKRVQGRGKDTRGDASLRAEFDKLCSNPNYTAMLETRARLPAFAARESFLSLLSQNRVVIVVGETGARDWCGKTTQLPQFILDSLISKNYGSRASIIITQPRRLSAVSVAARVSAERLDDGSVGYAIRGESKQSSTTKLLFCTTGVVLRRLGARDPLSDVTHIVVDEVHERSVDGDFLLLELKELLLTHPTLKVVLMSATINHETFVKYFNGAPLLSIPGFTHPVTDIYLEDVLPQIKYRAPRAPTTRNETEQEKKSFSHEYKAKGLDEDCVRNLQNVVRADRLDFQLVAAIVQHITATSAKRGGILVFLSGVQEIRQCIEALRKTLSSDQADIFPLHANLSSNEQRMVFNPSKKWKIIVATNVAETSITIDDVVFVIDSGKVKETQFDPGTGLTRLSEVWTTLAAGRQRRGRAGRTQPGTCYKLYTRRQEAGFGRFPIPEILRVPLDSIALTVKVSKDHEDVKTFLGKAIDPPTMDAMDQALCVLEDIGAINQDGTVSALGRHIAMLPLDLRLAKMLILGAIFQCLHPVLTVAACLSCKPLFLSPMDKREEATQARLRFISGSSDLLTDAHAYEEVIRLRSEGASNANVTSFCESNFISATTVRDITSLRQDFLSALSSTGLLPPDNSRTSPLNANASHVNLLKAVILGGLWPRVARAVLPRNAVKFDRVQAGAVQRANEAREFRLYDAGGGGPRVFVHPGSVLFSEAAWRAPFAAYFQKNMTTKVFLRDMTEIPIYALLLFGGPVSVNHVAGGLTISTRDIQIKLKAWPRIGVLINQLRKLLDFQLHRAIEEGTLLDVGKDNPVVRAMLALLANDGLTQ